MNYVYSCYGLTLSTLFPCPILPPAAPGAIPDMIMTEGPVPRTLDNTTAAAQNWQMAPGRFLLRGGRHGGRFLVEGGERITFQRNPGAEEPRLAVQFTASVLPVLLQQRGMLVMHANTVVTPRGGVAISGLSGAGKTTTLAALLQRGCPMLADDITVLRLGSDGTVDVVPGAPQLHLCADTAAEMGYDISGLPQYPWRRMKVAVPVPDAMAPEPESLKSMYLLQTGPGAEVRLEAQTGFGKFAVLQECLYGPLVPADEAGLFALHAAVLEQVALFRLIRPVRGRTVKEIAEVILHG